MMFRVSGKITRKPIAHDFSHAPNGGFPFFRGWLFSGVALALDVVNDGEGRSHDEGSFVGAAGLDTASDRAYS